MTRLAVSTEALIDPVCGMKVSPGKTTIVADYQGSTIYFCAEGCRKTFERNPRKYLGAKSSKPKGIWGRYLDRLSKATAGKSLRCH